MISVVIADDEKHICESLQAMLHKNMSGLQIDAVFYSGQTLKEYLEEHDTDLLIVDIEMPGATGLEIARMLRKAGKHTKVVIITAFQRFEYALNALESKVDAFIIKPYSGQQMLDTVQQLVEKIHQERREKKDAGQIDYFRDAIRLLYRTLSADRRTRILLPESGLSAWDAPCVMLQMIVHDWSKLDADVCDHMEKALCADVFLPHGSSPIIDLGFNDGVFSYLMFCPEENDREGFLRVLINTAMKQECVNVESISSSFSTFHEFLMVQRHARIVERFDNAARMNGLHLARLQLQTALQGMNEPETLAFTQYLRNEYNLPLSAGTEDDILNFMEENSAKYSQNSKNNYLIDAAKAFVREHYGQANLSLQQAADFLRVSPAYLSRRFKEVRGISFTAYCQHIRMEKAAELLRGTALPINAIAAEVGYDRGNTVYFRTSFKSIYGMTPRQYRESALREGVSEA